MRTHLIRSLALVVALSGAACLPACNNTPTQTNANSNLAGPGFGTIKGIVSANAVISTGGGNYEVLQARGVKGGKVKCVSGLDTEEVDVAEDGSFSAVVKAGAEYTVEATVPDGKGGVFKSVARINVPLAQEPQVADIGSLVTRRTGSIQGLVQLGNARSGDTPEGADVFLSGGTSVVGKVGESGRFALTNVPEGTWNVVVMKPGYARKTLQTIQVRAGRPSMVEAAVVLERETSEAKAGIKGVIQSTGGGAVAGATVSAFPKDRSALTGSDAGLDNFTAISDDQGNFEMLNLPPGEYQLQVYRPFYQMPPRQDLKVEANVTTDVGTVKLASTVAYFGKVSGQVVDEKGQPLDGAVIQLDPPVTESQFADAAGNFTLDRIMPGEYNMSISAGGYTTAVMPIRIENEQNFNLRLDGSVALSKLPGRSEEQRKPEIVVYPTDGTVQSFTWVGRDGDKTAQWTYGPDVQPDGHFRVSLDLPENTELSSITVFTTDRSGSKAFGQVWDTLSSQWWVLGVFAGDRPVNPGHIPTLGRYSGTVTFDLYGSDSGYFVNGMPFMVEVVTTQGDRFSGRLIMP